MTEVSQFWAGTETGHATRAPYSANEFSEYLYWLTDIGQYEVDLPNSVTVKMNGGVIKNYDSVDLACTKPGGTTVRMQSGAAVVDGRLYTNSGNVDFSLTAPGSGKNYYMLVLEADNAAQTVRAVMLGPVTNPADLVDLQITNHNDDYMMPVWVFDINNVSTIADYDCRRMLRIGGFQVPYSGGRRGGSSSDWSVHGTDAQEFGNDGGIMLGSVNQFAIALTEMFSTFYTWNSAPGAYGAFFSCQPISIYTVEGSTPGIVVKETTGAFASMCQSQMYNGATIIAHQINAFFIGPLQPYSIYSPGYYYYVIREKVF